MGDVTTGAENDLIEATRLARHMVMSWGMSELGLTAYEDSTQERFLGYEFGRESRPSECTAARIDQEIHRLLEEQREVVTNLITRERDKLDRLAACLLKQEVVEHKQLIDLLGPRPKPPDQEPESTHHKPDDSRIAASIAIPSPLIPIPSGVRDEARDRV